MADPRLKPCPFCGYEASELKEREGDNGHSYWYVGCGICGAGGDWMEQEDAIERWNARKHEVEDRQTILDFAPVQPDPPAVQTLSKTTISHLHTIAEYVGFQSGGSITTLKEWIVQNPNAFLHHHRGHMRASQIRYIETMLDVEGEG